MASKEKKTEKTSPSNENPGSTKSVAKNKEQAPLLKNGSLNAALERCRDVIKLNKNKIAITKKAEKQFVNNISKVTSDVRCILDDLKQQLGSMKSVGKINVPEAKIEVVSKQFFANKVLTNGKATKMTSKKNANNQNNKQNTKEDHTRNRNSSPRRMESGVKLSRPRRLSPSGNERIESSRGSTNSTVSNSFNNSNSSSKQITPIIQKKSNNSTPIISRNSSRFSTQSQINNKLPYTSSIMPKYSVHSVALSYTSSKTSIKSNQSHYSNQSQSKIVSQQSLPTRVDNSLHKAISDLDPLSALRNEVQRAIRNKKTFTVRGNYAAVRKALVQRGWVEKISIIRRDDSNALHRYNRYTIPELVPLLRNQQLSNVSRRLIISKLLDKHQVDFYWAYSINPFKENPDNVKYTIINRFKKDIFDYTSKQGLCEVALNSYWFQIPGVSQINHPRSYSLTRSGDTRGFIHDFNISAAMALLKWVVKNSITNESKIISPTGKIPIQSFEFAINECCKFIKKSEHADIDEEIADALECEWNQFLDYFYKLVHIGNHFKQSGTYTDENLVNKASFVLDKLREYWPYLDMDGMMNIWILKPTLGCRGQGIHICRTLQYVLKVVKTHPTVRYVIQKYIERPLLIYNTKFDIRQWFLISSANPLTIWIYKECYLRFSSQTYNLRKLHESIHLTNNAVQSRYTNKQSHDINLPTYNMWTLKQFLTYLTNIGFPNAYDERVFPGMKQSLTAAVLTHQDKIDKRPNCFELYGADFILTEDFTPWLLEINSSPALYASTPVTGKLGPEVLEDVVRVVIDYSRDKKASTGKFELVYKEAPSQIPNKNIDLKLTGHPLKDAYFEKEVQYEEILANESFIANANDIMQYNKAQMELKQLSKEIKVTLESLIKMIQAEKQRRQELKIIKYGNHSSTDTMFTARTDSKSSYEYFSDAREAVSMEGDTYIRQELKKSGINLSREDLADFMKTVINVLSENKKSL